MWGETGSGGQGDGREGQVGGGGGRGSEVIEESAGTSDSGPRGRSNDSRRPQDDGSKGGVGRPRYAQGGQGCALSVFHVGICVFA